MNVVLLLALQLICPTQASPAKVDELDPSIAASYGYTVRKLGIPQANGREFHVEGEVRLTVPVLSARTISFRRGSRLILDYGSIGPQPSQPYLMHGGANQFYLVADHIEVEDPNDPGTITWDPGPTERAPGSWLEPAAPGSSGADEGGAGSPGRAGTAGAPGVPGRSAPTIIIIAQRISGMPKIVLCGEPGARGGLGQAGGEGGRGGRGSSASQNPFNCNKGAGNGGTGGNGGEGGPGGLGGQGGDAGSVLVFTPRNGKFDPAILNAFIVGGTGGSGGDGGPGGLGGIGGPGGPEQMPWCRGSGAKGPDGVRGADGSNGISGKEGKIGRAAIGYLEPKQLHSIMKGEF